MEYLAKASPGFVPSARRRRFRPERGIPPVTGVALNRRDKTTPWPRGAKAKSRRSRYVSFGVALCWAVRRDVAVPAFAGDALGERGGARLLPLPLGINGEFSGNKGIFLK